jgi:hypothetical protein
LTIDFRKVIGLLDSLSKEIHLAGSHWSFAAILPSSESNSTQIDAHFVIFCSILMELQVKLFIRWTGEAGEWHTTLWEACEPEKVFEHLPNGPVAPIVGLQRRTVTCVSSNATVLSDR